MKQLKSKHLNRIKMYDLNGSDLKKYKASYMMGFNTYLHIKKREIPEINSDRTSNLKAIQEVKGMIEVSAKRGLPKKVGYSKKLVPLFLRYPYLQSISSYKNMIKAYRSRLQGTENSGLSELQLYKQDKMNFKNNLIISPKSFKSNIFKNKSYVGIEIEFFSEFSKEYVHIKLKNNKVYGFSLVHDGSLHSDSEDLQGSELRVFVENKPSSIEACLKKVCKVLSEIEAEVNKTCGLHVHFDVRNEKSITSKVKRLSNSLEVLHSLVPKSRRGNTYCKKAISKRRGERYFAVNLTSIAKHGTIEVRLHSGTVDYAKITNWIALLNLIMSTKNGIEFKSLDSMKVKLNMPNSLYEFYLGRYKLFNEIRNGNETIEDTSLENSIDNLDQAVGF